MGSLHKSAIKKRPEKSESAYVQNTCIKHRNNTYNRNNTHEAGALDRADRRSAAAPQLRAEGAVATCDHDNKGGEQ